MKIIEDYMFTDFTHYAYQLAFFMNSGAVATDEFSVACRKRLNIGPFSPQFFPSFPGMPDEMPRIQIQTESGYGVVLTGTRVDLLLERPYGLSASDRETYLKNVMELSRIVEESGSSFSRIGLVRKFLKADSQPAKYISDMFGSKGGGKLVDFGVNGVLRSEFEGRPCNDVYNFSAAKIRGTEDGVVLFRDFNIVPGATTLDGDEARRFVVKAESLITIESFVQFVEGI